MFLVEVSFKMGILAQFEFNLSIYYNIIINDIFAAT